MQSPASEARDLIAEFGLFPLGELVVTSPIDGREIATVRQTTPEEAISAIEAAHFAFQKWRLVPAPRRGEFVRQLGMRLRGRKHDLARLVTIECGKPISESLGEVQEMVDICDFAVGLSRQLHGLTIASERPGHRMMESWHPLGVVGVISAFNFPVAVWSWNAALALICGNSVIWKPSEKTPLTAMAVQSIFAETEAEFGPDAPPSLSTLLVGGASIGAVLVDHPKISLVSATGSTPMGRIVGERVARRFGRSLLELGGNNASIVTPSADLELALRACAFGFMGTTGQRCTSLRRLFVHETLYDRFVARMQSAASSIAVGDPRDPTTLVGPLIDEQAFRGMEASLASSRATGGEVSGGERLVRDGVYVRPAIVQLPSHSGPVMDETFAPILYAFRYSELENALAMHNAVSQGLSSSIFTTDMREAEHFLSSVGSDCGIANVNIGTSGAEIGGAFGGEKETGGGRESGSDSWKAYMRRQTSTVNFSSELPLAQGVKFDI